MLLLLPPPPLLLSASTLASCMACAKALRRLSFLSVGKRAPWRETTERYSTGSSISSATSGLLLLLLPPTIPSLPLLRNDGSANRRCSRLVDVLNSSGT